MKILNSAEMREVDTLTTKRHGLPALTLMENAGARVAEFLETCCADLLRKRIVVLCGKGNNGGDGLVAARILHEKGLRPVVFLFSAPEALQGEAAASLQQFTGLAGDLRVIRTANEWNAEEEVWGKAGLVVDAMLGTGLRGPVEGILKAVMGSLAAHRGSAKIVAVDIPSGVSADTGEILSEPLQADATVTFTAPKLGQFLHPGSGCVGRLVVGDIGSPPELVEEVSARPLRWVEPAELRACRVLFSRKAESHKGDFGHALIIGGSVGKSGAAVLAGSSALRVGAGLVTVATPEKAQQIVAGALPELMTEPLASTEEGAISLRALEGGRFSSVLVGKTAMAIGPGLSQNAETQEFVRRVVADARVPVIVDADGLNAFAGKAAGLRDSKSPRVILTPHPGEMARLAGSTAKDVQAARMDVARKASAEWKASIVLKGHHTVIALPDGRVWINSTGNPGMATGGTGDALTGILAGLLAQKAAPWPETLLLGVYLHGLAGDIAAAEVGETSLMASDLVRALPRAVAHLRMQIEGA